jgi:hypothetical protein
MTDQSLMTATGRAGAPSRPPLTAAWAAERASARTARAAGDIAAEWHHLERAHILSQPVALLHVRTHVAMLGVGLRRHAAGRSPANSSGWSSLVPAR